MRTIRRMAQKIAAEPRDPERREPEKSPPRETSALTHALQRNHSQLDRKFSICQPVIALLSATLHQSILLMYNTPRASRCTRTGSCTAPPRIRNPGSPPP